MTEAQWLAGVELREVVEWLRERDSNRLDRFAAAYRGQTYHALSPHVLSAGAHPDGRPFLWLVQADDHDNQWEEAWAPATGLPLLHCFFGNPFRAAVFSPEWCTDTVVAVARQMYELGEFSAMPILADALQDAGCDSEDILDHCRGPGLHIHGCWVVDLIVARK
jgi:hypothetical protein